MNDKAPTKKPESKLKYIPLPQQRRMTEGEFYFASLPMLDDSDDGLEVESDDE